MIIDDHPAIREAFASALPGTDGIELCGEAASAEEGLRLIGKVQPDVVVMDLRLNGRNRLDLVLEISTRYPMVRVLVYSLYDERVYARLAVSAGALGYIMKGASWQEVVQAIRTISNGEVCVSRDVASRLLSRIFRDRNRLLHLSLDDLSKGERAVFQLMGEGYTSIDDIAEALNLNRSTVEKYRRRAKVKLGLNSVSDLLHCALQWAHEHTPGSVVQRQDAGV